MDTMLTTLNMQGSCSKPFVRVQLSAGTCLLRQPLSQKSKLYFLNTRPCSKTAEVLKAQPLAVSGQGYASDQTGSYYSQKLPHEIDVWPGDCSDLINVADHAAQRSAPLSRAVVAAAAATRRTKRRWTELPLNSPPTQSPSRIPPGPSALPFNLSDLPRSTTRARHSALPQTPKPATCSTTLSDSVLLRYEREGFVVTPRLLPATQMASLRDACEAEVSSRRLDSLRHRVRVLCPGVDPSTLATEADARAALEQQATDELGFLQFFNLHRSNKTVAQVALGSQLAAVAAQLLGCRRVRVYQDSLFLKEPGFAETNWHSDLRMAPLDTNDFVTAWIPLRRVRGSASGATGDSGLRFAAGSHRDFALPFWHDMDGRDLSDRGYGIKDMGPMEVGDVSWHHGWTLHCAAPQPLGTPPRLALSVAFFADGARLLPRRSDPSVRAEMLHDEDAESYTAWLPALSKSRDGAVARHKLLPVVWPQDASEAGNFPLRNSIFP